MNVWRLDPTPRHAEQLGRLTFELRVRAPPRLDCWVCESHILGCYKPRHGSLKMSPARVEKAPNLSASDLRMLELGTLPSTRLMPIVLTHSVINRSPDQGVCHGAGIMEDARQGLDIR